MALRNVESARKFAASAVSTAASRLGREGICLIDRYLDRAECGPLFLKQEAIATLVIVSLLKGVELEHYQLGAFVLMANHVHVLLLPSVHPSHLMKSLKGHTARAANSLLGRSGEPFWQHESYDHWVRNQEEWLRIAAYIENNPVKAGFVSRAEQFRWSSAHETWRDKVNPPGVGNSADVASKSACVTSEDK